VSVEVTVICKGRAMGGESRTSPLILPGRLCVEKRLFKSRGDTGVPSALTRGEPRVEGDEEAAVGESDLVGVAGVDAEADVGAAIDR
jgi:hypothetical protein